MARSLLSREEMSFWHAWKRAHDVVMSAVERDLQARAGISGADFGVLSRLVDLGDGELRQQDLADLLTWDKSRLSHQLDRMEARGLVERARTSAKSVHVRITRQARATLTQARLVHAASVRSHLLDELSAEDRPRMLALLERLTGGHDLETS